MNTEAIAGQSTFGMHKGTQGIHLRLRLTACDKKIFFLMKLPLQPFDVGNLDHETIGMDLLQCLCGSY